MTEIQDLPQLEHWSPNKVMRPFKGIVLNSVYGTSSIRNCVSQAASYCKKTVDGGVSQRRCYVARIR